MCVRERWDKMKETLNKSWRVNNLFEIIPKYWKRFCYNSIHFKSILNVNPSFHICIHSFSLILMCFLSIYFFLIHLHILSSLLLLICSYLFFYLLFHSPFFSISLSISPPTYILISPNISLFQYIYILSPSSRRPHHLSSSPWSHYVLLSVQLCAPPRYWDAPAHPWAVSPAHLPQLPPSAGHPRAQCAAGALPCAQGREQTRDHILQRQRLHLIQTPHVPHRQQGRSRTGRNRTQIWDARVPHPPRHCWHEDTWCRIRTPRIHQVCQEEQRYLRECAQRIEGENGRYWIGVVRLGNWTRFTECKIMRQLSTPIPSVCATVDKSSSRFVLFLLLGFPQSVLIFCALYFFSLHHTTFPFHSSTGFLFYFNHPKTLFSLNP